MAPNAFTTDHSHDDDHWPLNDKQKAVFMDWVEQGLDFFGCDENAPKKVFNAAESALRIPQEPHQETDPQHLDYARLHDELIESLMAEQTKKANDPNNTSVTDFDSSASSFSFSNNSANSQSLLNTSASTANSSLDFDFNDEDTTAPSEVSAVSASSSKRGHKRPRALKLHRRVMPALVSKTSEEKTVKRRLSTGSSLSSMSTANNSSVVKRGTSAPGRQAGPNVNDAVPIDLAELQGADFPPASSFLHPQCRMQKDKGKGEAAGSNICAKGREHCLLKLEQKIALITHYAIGGESKHKGKPEMERRPARVAEVFSNFTETRSMIDLKIGFLTMKYGILLRWDTTRTGKVTLVVLRKNCYESFYPKWKPQRKPLFHRKVSPVSAEPPTYAVRNVVDGNKAILQRPDGLEVALLEPPYRVDRPDSFAPTLLSMAVQYGTGLSPKSTWTVQLCYDGKTENVFMTWDSDQDCFTPKLGGALKQEIPAQGSLQLHALEIRLFEHRQKRGKSRRCVAHMNVPLIGLEAQPASDAKPRDLKVVSTHDPDACLTLSALLQSDYAHWLRKELDARRREEVKAFAWKKTVRVVDPYDTSPDLDVDEYEGLWEWICGVC